jgi:glucosamine kinase
MAKFLAIDGGGTNTRCWLADEERVLASATDGTVKLMVVGEEVATKRLRELLQAVAAEAGVGLDEIACTCVGLAGISSGNVRHWGEETLRGLVSGKVIVCGDEEIALEAGFKGGPGVFLIAGTGSIVSGRCSDGTRFTAGGFGPVIGDEGAGGWIGLEAVRASLRARDRGLPTELPEKIQEFWGLKSLPELIAKANHYSRAPFGELTMVVVSAAESGDRVAIRVLERAGEDLADQVLVLVEKMRAAGCEAGDYARLRFTGSVVGKIVRVRETMTRKLHEAFPGMDVPEAEVNAIEGALWLARQG